MSMETQKSLDERYPHLGLCSRCKLPTKGRRRGEPPFVCGQCYADIHNAAGRKAVRAYLAKQEGESE